MDWIIDFALLAMLMVTAVAIAWTRDLFAAVMLAGLYGLVSASFFVAMDAVDVAFTEAAVGAGITPLLLLVSLRMTGQREAASHNHPWAALAIVVVVGVLLVLGEQDMPAFGSPDAPAHQHVAPHYLQQSAAEIGIPNVVTSILASYRAFDTLGEVAVIFTACIGVLALLVSGLPPDERARPHAPHSTMEDQIILRVVGKILIPPIMLFALYVQFHGEYGPGGGFQAGVIFASAVIVYVMLFGLDAAARVMSVAWLRFAAAFGLLLYGAVGVVCLLAGERFLDYHALLPQPIAAQHAGILVIELGVGITVAAVVILLFFAFVGRLSRPALPTRHQE
ncbi:MAG: DUF4040 domain-containing protein [Gammaproteobacteria bacterium]|nr:DUF4040 domain-containing protein [Gammaproteobacteria bacterium]